MGELVSAALRGADRADFTALALRVAYAKLGVFCLAAGHRMVTDYATARFGHAQTLTISHSHTRTLAHAHTT